MAEEVDIVVVGAGAAGLMAAIHAARAGPDVSVFLVDGARKLGAKILVAGGGRCNVTHEVVSERDYAGSSPAAIRKVLRSFDVEQTIDFFDALGVSLKREATGKLFPVTDRARTVLDALLRAAAEAGAHLLHPWRVESVERVGDRFLLTGPEGALDARRVVLATGGCSLPKSGSDGHGHTLATSLGHGLTAHVFPALVPLCLPDGHPLCALKGVALPVRVEVRGSSGAVRAVVTGSLLLTHFGLSGPAALDVSRHYQGTRFEDPAAVLVVSWLPEWDAQALERSFVDLAGASPLPWLAERLPQRLAQALCTAAGIDPARPRIDLPRERRRALVRAVLEMALPIEKTRGWTYAEVTAGGVPLREVDLRTMASRACPGLHLCGEILDVDGRIGGFNFQWAWSSGHVAGLGAAAAIASGS